MKSFFFLNCATKYIGAPFTVQNCFLELPFEPIYSLNLKDKGFPSFSAPTMVIFCSSVHKRSVNPGLFKNISLWNLKVTQRLYYIRKIVFIILYNFSFLVKIIFPLLLFSRHIVFKLRPHLELFISCACKILYMSYIR